MNARGCIIKTQPTHSRRKILFVQVELGPRSGERKIISTLVCRAQPCNPICKRHYWWHELSHIFFATWCPSQKIRKFPARMVNLARARNFLCPSQVMPFCLSPPRLTCPFIPSFWNAVLTIFICACRNVGCFCAITTTLQAPGNEMWVSCIFSFLLWFLGSVASIHRPYPAYIKLCIMLFWPFCLHVEIFLFACRNLSYDFSCCETAARKESHWIFQGPMLLQQGLS